MANTKKAPTPEAEAASEEAPTTVKKVPERAKVTDNTDAVEVVQKVYRKEVRKVPGRATVTTYYEEIK